MRKFFIAWMFVVTALVAVVNAGAGMMGDLPKAVPAVNYSSSQTYSIWSEKGMLLYAGVPAISVTSSGLHFFNHGQALMLNLRPNEAVIISADPRIPGGPQLPAAPFQQRVGPRK
jgi:hypothetical protein